MSPKVIVIGAGKGGVGKTFVASSIAITLAKLGGPTLLIDCDLSGANVHTTLGIPVCSATILSYLNNEQALMNLVQPTNIPRLSFIQGAWEEWAPANLTVTDAKKFLKDLRQLKFDNIVIDLGAGATDSHLELFKGGDEKILVSSPEPTSIEKTYRFIEAFIVSKLAGNTNAAGIEQLQNSLKKYRAKNKKGFFSFRHYLSEAVEFSFDHFETLNQQPIRLILNGTRSHLDQQLGYSIKSVCNKYYDLAINYTGFVDYDNAVWQSIRNREPFLIEMPFTPLSGQFLSICKNIVTTDFAPNQLRAVI